MDKKTKKSFKNLLGALSNKNVRDTYNLYAQYYKRETGFNKSDKKARITVIGLAVMLENHHVDNRPDEWRISIDDAHMIRGYFNNAKSLKYAVLDLYKNFPRKLEGESMEALEVYRVDLSEKEKKIVKMIE